MAADPDAVRASSLGNGIRLVSERMPDVRSVALGFWVDVGSRDEAQELAGVSHFLEHLLFKGTEERSARQIAESVEAVGGEMNAFTTKEYTAFYTRLLDADLDLGLDVLCDIMAAPAFRPDEIDAERQVILEEILMHEDEPADLVHDTFLEAMFPGHPLGREVLNDEIPEYVLAHLAGDRHRRTQLRQSHSDIGRAPACVDQEVVRRQQLAGFGQGRERRNEDIGDKDAGAKDRGRAIVSGFLAHEQHAGASGERTATETSITCSVA